MLKTSGSFPTVMGSRTDIAGSPITLSHIPGSQNMWECASYRISAQCQPDNCHVHVQHDTSTPPPPEYTPAEVQGFPYHEMVWVGPLANLEEKAKYSPSITYASIFSFLLISLALSFV